MVDSALPHQDPESAAAEPAAMAPEAEAAAAEPLNQPAAEAEATLAAAAVEPVVAATPPDPAPAAPIPLSMLSVSDLQEPAAAVPPPAEPSTEAAAPAEIAAAPAVEPLAAAPSAGVASTITVPPLPGGDEPSGDGGEFELLLNRLSAWLQGLDLAAKWDGLQGPLRGLAVLLVALVLLRLYGALLDTLAGLPLVPRLLQLVGLVALLQFSLANLVRTSDRERVIARWQQRWLSFRGRP